MNDQMLRVLKLMLFLLIVLNASSCATWFAGTPSSPPFSNPAIPQTIPSSKIAQLHFPEGRVGRLYWVMPILTEPGSRIELQDSMDTPVPGLTWQTDGSITGVPQQPGEFEIGIRVISPSGFRSSQNVGIKIAERVAHLGTSSANAETQSDEQVVVHPKEYLQAFKNPLEGMRPYLDNARNHPFASLGRQYVSWNLLEDSVNDNVDKIKEVSNRLFSKVANRNIKVIPRVILQWPPSYNFWPSDLRTGDYSSAEFKVRLLRLVSRLGEAWDNDPRIAYIETGLVGLWGEEHDPWFPTSAPAGQWSVSFERLLGDAFVKAFPHKLLMHRFPRDFVGYPFGIHWDVFGAFDKGFWANDSTLMKQELTKPELVDNWKKYPNGGEIDPTFLGERDWSPKSQENAVRKYTPRLVELIKELHWNHLAVLEKINPDDSELWAKASEIQNALGYRFVITEAKYNSILDPGRMLDLHLKIVNAGSTPFYYQWPVQVQLLDPESHRVVWAEVWDSIDVRTWLPGESINLENTFQIPKTVPTGQYVLSISILDPSGMVPAVRFAVQNYFAGGYTPLGPVGLGTQGGSLRLSDFDDLQADDSLYYLP